MIKFGNPDWNYNQQYTNGHTDHGSITYANYESYYHSDQPINNASNKNDNVNEDDINENAKDNTKRKMMLKWRKTKRRRRRQ